MLFYCVVLSSMKCTSSWSLNICAAGELVFCFCLFVQICIVCRFKILTNCALFWSVWTAFIVQNNNCATYFRIGYSSQTEGLNSRWAELLCSKLELWVWAEVTILGIVAHTDTCFHTNCICSNFCRSSEMFTAHWLPSSTLGTLSFLQLPQSTKQTRATSATCLSWRTVRKEREKHSAWWQKTKYDSEFPLLHPLHLPPSFANHH